MLFLLVVRWLLESCHGSVFKSAQVLEHSTEAPSAKTLAVLRDPSKGKRGAQFLSWHPDGSRKV